MTARQHISMSSPDLTADDIAAVNAVLQTTVLSIGQQMKQSPSLGGIAYCTISFEKIVCL